MSSRCPMRPLYAHESACYNGAMRFSFARHAPPLFSACAGLSLSLMFYVPSLSVLFFLPPLFFFLTIFAARNSREAAQFGYAGILLGSLAALYAVLPSGDVRQFIIASLKPEYRILVFSLAVILPIFIAGWLSLPFAAAGALAKKIRSRRSWTAFAALPAIWALAEYARTKIFFEFIGDGVSVGYFLFDAVSPLGVLGRWIGVYGLGFLAALIALIILDFIAHKRIAPVAGAAVGFVVVLAAFGATALARISAEMASLPKIPAVVFQGNIPPHASYAGLASDDLVRGLFIPNVYTELIQNALLYDKDFVRGGIAAFPEGSLPMLRTSSASASAPQGFFFDIYALEDGSALWGEEQKGIENLRALLGAREIVAGQLLVSSTSTINATLSAREGERPNVYGKRFLFPLTERVPFSRDGKNPINTLFSKPIVMSIDASDDMHYGAGILSCVELLYRSPARREVGGGASVLISPGSEATWGRAIWEHDLLIFRFRALETGRYILRAQKVGYSAIIDPLGRVQARSKGNYSETVLGHVSEIGAQK